MTVGFALGAFPSISFAHENHAHASRTAAWNSDPLIIASLALITIGYATGLAALWRTAGAGRGVRTWQAACFAGGMAVLVLALLSPIAAIAEQLNSVHMIQHMLLMMVAAPLLVLGVPMIVGLRALPLNARNGLARLRKRIEQWRSPWYLLWQPILMWAVFALVLWIWHLPTLYEAALRHQRFHDLQHLAFVVAACLFWRVLLDPFNRLRMGFLVGIFYLFTTTLHATLLGVFMALSPRVWYAPYVGRTELWGLTALEDQQLAGLIMWMPACMLFAVAAVVLCWLWIAWEERHQPHAPNIPPSAPAPEAPLPLTLPEART